MIRKILIVVEETHREGGHDVHPATRKAAAIAVIANPFAGRYVDDLATLVTIGETLGDLLGNRAVHALGIAASAVESYGKAAIVGEDGELEHAAAILHPKLGAPFRAARRCALGGVAPACRLAGRGLVRLQPAHWHHPKIGRAHV